MKIRLDLHVHTEKSFDSEAKLSDIIKSAKAAGLSGIAVTDHDTAGESFMADDFIVISGAEYSTDAGHLLVYFLEGDIAEGLSQNEKGQYPWRETINRAHEAGALCFWAHPYAPEIEKPTEAYELADGIECYNARICHSRAKNPNERAQKKCRSLKKAFCAGSDGHFPEEIASAFFECEIERSENLSEMLSAIKSCLIDGRGSIYGGRSNAIYRAKSARQGMAARGGKIKWHRLLPRYLRSAVQSIKGSKAAEKIDF